MDPNEFAKMLEAAKAAEMIQQQQVQLQQLQMLQQQQPQLSSQIMEPHLAGLLQVQQSFASGAAPSLVVAPTHIPLYPGYAQVPPGPGYISNNPKTKYIQLLQVIEEMSRDLRPTYAGNKISAERYKRGIAQARILLRECMIEQERR